MTTSETHDPGHTIPEATLPPVITIDGPGGSGKGTVSLHIAKTLDWHFLDSGLIYRILAWNALQRQLDLMQEAPLAELAKGLSVQFHPNGTVICEGQDITTQIRQENCGNMASKIAVYPKVRESLLARQREFRKPPGLVADGRDMGTIVFPDAFLKIFLEASPIERAKRRFLQLKDTLQNVTLHHLLAEIEERDRRDKQRATAPLKPAADAVIIDTTDLTIEMVFDEVMKHVKQRGY